MTPTRREGRSVLVTHADEPVGRRLIKTLYHDDDVACIWALGQGRPPRSFDRFLRGADNRLHYRRLDLAKHRPVADLFHSPEIRDAAIDCVVHIPRHGAAAGSAQPRPLVARVAERTAEARLILQQCLESSSVRRLVALGSAFVYRLEPGNANRLTEESALDLDPDVPPDIRSWIDCDMIFHGEIHNQRIDVCLLRVPTVVASGGYVFMNPSLQGPAGTRIRPMGFDPLCTLIADKDVARAAHLSVHRGRAGIFNVSGREAVPLSLLARWTGATTVPVPGIMLSGVSRVAELVVGDRWRTSLEGGHLRYGFTLDTRRAERELGFRPGYRIGLSRAGDGKLRIETAPA